MKDRIRRLAARVLARSGAVAVWRGAFPRPGAVILYGHRVTGDNEGYLEGLQPEWLDSQLGYLTRHYEVISLSDLLACYEERRPVPERAAVITFDDGFRDNIENALPILEKHHVTATVFLVTQSIDTGQLPWSQRLGFLFQHTNIVEFRCSAVSGQNFVMSDPGARRHVYDAVKEPMKEMTRERREAVLDEAGGMEFGAHTYSHPYLARISFKEARWEIQRSLDDLRRMLSIDRPSFCFPAGSLTPQLVELVRTLGFRSGFQPDPRRRPNTLETAGLFSLGRRGMPNGPRIELAAELDGPLDSIRSIVHRFSGVGGD